MIPVKTAGRIVAYSTLDGAISAANAPSEQRSRAKADALLFVGRRFVDAIRNERECLIEFAGHLWLRVFTVGDPGTLINGVDADDATPSCELIGWEVHNEAPVIARSVPTVEFEWQRGCAVGSDFAMLVESRRESELRQFRVNEMGFHVHLEGRMCISFGPLRRLDNGELLLYVGEDG